MKASSSDIETIQHQFDTLIKKNLKGESRSCIRDMANRAKKEVTFSELSEDELNQLYTEDEYDFEYSQFNVFGFDITVRDILLGEALGFLSEKKRDIILLSYFLDMSDDEIGRLLNVVRSTVFRNRKTALKNIKKYMEGKADEDK